MKKLNEKMRLAAVALARKSFQKSKSTTTLFRFVKTLPTISGMKDKFFNENNTLSFIVKDLLPLNTWHVLDRLCTKLKIAILLCRVGAHFRNFEDKSSAYRNVKDLLEEAEEYQREDGGLNDVDKKLSEILLYDFAAEVQEVQNWVQCDICSRWREVPKNVTLQSNKEWRCSMATWTRFVCKDNAAVVENTQLVEEKREPLMKSKRKRSSRGRRRRIVDTDEEENHEPLKTVPENKRRRRVTAPFEHPKSKPINILVPPNAKPNSIVQFSYGGETFSVPVPDKLELKRTNRTLTVDLESSSSPPLDKSTIPKKKKKKKKPKTKRKILNETATKSQNQNESSKEDEDDSAYIEREVLRCLADPTFPSFVARIGGIIQRVKENAISVLDQPSQRSSDDVIQHTPSKGSSDDGIQHKPSTPKDSKKDFDDRVKKKEEELCSSPEMIRVSNVPEHLFS